MAADLSIVLEGTLGTGSSALNSGGSAYTVPTGRKLIITELSLVNKTATAQTATITSSSGTTLWPGKSVTANDGYLQQRQTQILSGKQIMGFAGAATSIDYYLSCLEVDS
ncbi:hypothetical protein ACJDU8_15800 [Clostridium sp. WILCCON 0269]|uniref:Uncharacterized protein n=1 Tax=Candidatus Clostridium eludens TaxID=3381663 RepID=A0ABW8SNS4_9CLOT